MAQQKVRGRKRTSRPDSDTEQPGPRARQQLKVQQRRRTSELQKTRMAHLGSVSGRRQLFTRARTRCSPAPRTGRKPTITTHSLSTISAEGYYYRHSPDPLTQTRRETRKGSIPRINPQGQQATTSHLMRRFRSLCDHVPIARKGRLHGRVSQVAWCQGERQSHGC